MFKSEKLARMIELGIIVCNEPAVADAGTGGGGDIPAPAPSNDSASGGDDGVDWGNMFSEESDTPTPAPSAEPAAPVAETPPTGEAAPVPAAPTEPAVPETPPPAEPAAQPAEGQQPATPQTPPQEPVTPAEPQPQQPPQQSPEEIQQARQAARDQWAEQLAQEYAFSDEEADELQSNPAAMLPKMAANLHIRVFEGTAQFLQQNLPNMVNSVIQQNEQRTAGLNAFYDAWPELKGKDDLLISVGSVWRQNNPTASQEEFIEQVGPLVWSAAKLSMQDLVNRGGNPAAPPAAAPPQPQIPAVPQGPAGGYSPVPSAGAAAPAAPSVPQNAFAALAEDWKED